MASTVERGFGRQRSRAISRSKRCSDEIRAQNDAARNAEQQLRDFVHPFSTFMLDASAQRELGRLARIRASCPGRRRGDSAGTKSFKYVVAIAVSHTNVWPHPIALGAPRVYLRGCDARPDARIDHLQAPPPLWLPP